MHERRRLKLMRLIKTGQLPAAAMMATGGQSRPAGLEHDVKDEVKKQLEALGVQRRGLAEVRKTLEKQVVQPKETDANELGRTLGFMLRGYAKKDAVVPGDGHEEEPGEPLSPKSGT